MTHVDVVTEALYWLRTIVLTAVVMMLGVWAAMGLGYFTQKVEDQRALNCINAACEEPCEPNKKFKRHEGCAK